MKRPVYVGVDGGGTKTTAALCDQTGTILACKSSDSANMQSRPWIEIEKTLHQLLDDLLYTADFTENDVSTVFFGLAGADRPSEKRTITSSFAARFGSSLFIDNDAVNALYSGTLGAPGIVLIAGTGSIVYAVDPEGKRHRVGGWGYLFGDEGSGFDLGKKALTAIFRELDGRGRETRLTELVLQHFAVEEPAQLISMIYRSSNPRRIIGELSPLVMTAAEKGDELSIKLITDAADSLVELVLVCLQKTNLQMPIVLSGGLLSRGTVLQQKVQQQLKNERTVIIPPVPPVVGSLVWAMQYGQIVISNLIKENLVQSWLARNE